MLIASPDISARGTRSAALVQLEGDLKVGRAPRSGMERALQNFLESLAADEEMG